MFIFPVPSLVVTNPSEANVTAGKINAATLRGSVHFRDLDTIYGPYSKLKIWLVDVTLVDPGPDRVMTLGPESAGSGSFKNLPVGHEYQIKYRGEYGGSLGVVGLINVTVMIGKYLLKCI